MIEEIRLILTNEENYTDAQIAMAYKLACMEVKAICNRQLDEELEYCAEQIAVIKLNKLGSEGLASESYSGVSQSYLTEYPKEITSVLQRKRRISCY